ncbi:Uncharacterised protein [Mycobacteroides abscessus subsp. abscessus]|nr:Uncharacterised protein [Mycobacteroides abscessus subsp. abscessus]
MVAQLLADLPADLVGVLEDAGEVAVGGQPLRRGLVPDPGDAGEVVGLLPHQGCEAAVVGGGDPVLLLDRLRRHPHEVAHPALGVEDRHGVGGELERVLVPGHHLDARAGLPPEAGHRRERIVGLIALLRHHPDAHGGDDVLDEVDLRVELRRRLRPPGLVLRVLLKAEGLASEVEGDGDVARRLVAEHIDEHRDEPEDRVRRLAGARREVLRREGVEGPVGKGVTVDEQEGFVSVTHMQ